MGFVFVLRRAAQRGRASQLAKALKERGLDVCVGLQNEPAEVRPSVSRSLIDHCTVMAALWSEADLSDPAFVEPMRYAATEGKLIAMSLDGAFLPASFGEVAEAPAGWNNRATFGEVCDALAEKARQNSTPHEWAAADAFTASEEYAAYNRMQKQGGVEAMARFLREYSGGMLEDIVRSELDSATRPTYEPAANRGWSMAKSDEPNQPGNVWRMGDGSPANPFETVDRRWLWAAGGVLALGGLALAAVLAGPTVQLDLRPRMADAGQSSVEQVAPAQPRGDPLPAAVATPIVQAMQAEPPPPAEPQAADRIEVAAIGARAQPDQGAERQDSALVESPPEPQA
jgi:hypothetical protein